MVIGLTYREHGRVRLWPVTPLLGVGHLPRHSQMVMPLGGVSSSPQSGTNALDGVKRRLDLAMCAGMITFLANQAYQFKSTGVACADKAVAERDPTNDRIFRFHGYF